MKRNGSKLNGHSTPTLAELVAAVSELAVDERLSALIVADMINKGKVRLGGEYQGRRVVVG